MAGLVLKMAPKERVLINGAVLENGSRRSRFSIITPSANVLRLKDAIHPDEANTPMGRVCYQLQLVLAGNGEPDQVSASTLDQIVELSRILRDPFSQAQLSLARDAVVQGKFYNALKSLKVLLPLEQELLSHRLA
jgi:flagellar protein FlbT